MSPLRKRNEPKRRGRLGTLFAVGSSVTLAPVLARRFRDARAKGDKLALADAAVSAAALAVGVLQVLRSRKSRLHQEGGDPRTPAGQA